MNEIILDIENINDEIELDIDDKIGTTNYNDLSNKPSINGVELAGELTSASLNLQEKEEGKGLSSNDFTDREKHKLEQLENYNDTEIRRLINELDAEVDSKVNKVPGHSLVSDSEIAKLETLTNYDDTEVRGLIGNKQDKLVAGDNIKIEGNVISSTGGGSSYDDTEIRRELSNKVEKIEGKELSSNDFTDTLKTKLEGLSNYNDTELRGLIDNKVDKVSGKVLSTNDYTTEEKTKLAGLTNYDDTELRNKIGNIDSVLETLTVGEGI